MPAVRQSPPTPLSSCDAAKTRGRGGGAGRRRTLLREEGAGATQLWRCCWVCNGEEEGYPLPRKTMKLIWSVKASTATVITVTVVMPNIKEIHCHAPGLKSATASATACAT